MKVGFNGQRMRSGANCQTFVKSAYLYFTVDINRGGEQCTRDGVRASQPPQLPSNAKDGSRHTFGGYENE